jgi:hypothetical protein
MKNIKIKKSTTKKKKPKKPNIAVVDNPIIIINSEKPKLKIKETPEEFLISLFNEMKQTKEKGNTIFSKNNNTMIIYESTYNILYVDYKGVWNILEINFDYSYQQIKDLFIFVAQKLYKYKKINILFTI